MPAKSAVIESLETRCLAAADAGPDAADAARLPAWGTSAAAEPSRPSATLPALSVGDDGTLRINTRGAGNDDVSIDAQGETIVVSFRAPEGRTMVLEAFSWSVHSADADATIVLGSDERVSYLVSRQGVKRISIDTSDGTDSVTVSRRVPVRVVATNVEVVATPGPTPTPRPKPTPDAAAAPARRNAAATPRAGTINGSPEAWFDRLEGDKADLAHSAPPLVFVGDSYIERWLYYGRRDWKARYESLGAANVGVSGESTRNLLYRVRNGLFEPADPPKVVVLMIGANNFNTDTGVGTDAEVARAIGTIVSALREQLPRTHVLVHGILPRTNKAISDRAAAVNERIRSLDDGRYVHVVDISDAVSNADGTPRADLYEPDKGHLNKAGYRVWANLIDPLVKRYLRKA